MTGYFFHCQHKYRTQGKKRTLNKSQRDESAHCAHDVDASIDVVIISVLCIWTGVYFHHRDYDSFFCLFFSLFRQFVHLRNSWLVLLIFLCSLFLFLIFFRACCLHTFLRTIARDLFVPFIFSRILPPKYEDCFSV